jgi:hypothetical protein
MFSLTSEGKMTQSLDQNVDVLRSRAPLLNAESADEFALLQKELKDEIRPEGVIEQICVDDFAVLVWESLRYRRYKTAMINNSRLAALQGILEQLLCAEDYEHSYEKDRDAEALARDWFGNQRAQARVAKLLRKFQMDEGAIEAGAFRLCFEELERLDRMPTFAEVRRDRALRFIADYRQLLAKQLRQTATEFSTTTRCRVSSQWPSDRTDDGERAAN